MPTLAILLEKSEVAFENNECGFSEKNVLALCNIGGSTKQKHQGYIGNKGIGFKSVFKVQCARCLMLSMQCCQCNFVNARCRCCQCDIVVNAMLIMQCCHFDAITTANNPNKNRSRIPQ